MKKKSDMANKSSQSIAKTLKMFQEMDAKEQVNPTKPTKLKFCLNTEPSNDKAENICKFPHLQGHHSEASQYHLRKSLKVDFPRF